VKKRKANDVLDMAVQEALAPAVPTAEPEKKAVRPVIQVILPS
jgi:hypothetical protein